MQNQLSSGFVLYGNRNFMLFVFKFFSEAQNDGTPRLFGAAQS